MNAGRVLDLLTWLSLIIGVIAFLALALLTFGSPY